MPLTVHRRSRGTAAFADGASRYRIHARPVERSAPHYPVHNIRRAQQAWVVPNCVVTGDCRTVEPFVEKPRGSRLFGKRLRTR